MIHLGVRCAPILLIGVLLLPQMGLTGSSEDKMPITTSSKKALEYYLQGRDLFEKLQAQESQQFFRKAVAEDPDFALGYLQLSFTVPSAKEFFENLDKAVALADRVSKGERLWIHGVQAGTNAFPVKQREYYQELVKMYPNDERVHNLLATNYFGQQDYEKAIAEYTKSTQIAPDFSQPYNQLGYAYRFLERYEDSERAFERYIELIPNDPNPYDSYAELLMKIGRYSESIDNYKKALTFNPNFVASHIGIATNLNFLGKHSDARAQLQKLHDIARNDGERRATYFATAVSHADEGNLDRALKEAQRLFESNEKINDAAAMSGNLVLMGNILLEMDRVDEAAAKYDKAVEVISQSNLSEGVKENGRRGYLYNTARVALKKGNFAFANAKSKEYQKQVMAINHPNQIRLSRELAGMIALEEKNYDRAIEELQQANQQNPYNLYRIALSYRGNGDREKSKEFCKKAAYFNGLNNLNYAFIRMKAKDMLASI